jgi:hypothetical protein
MSISGILLAVYLAQIRVYFCPPTLGCLGFYPVVQPAEEDCVLRGRWTTLAKPSCIDMVNFKVKYFSNAKLASTLAWHPDLDSNASSISLMKERHEILADWVYVPRPPADI